MGDPKPCGTFGNLFVIARQKSFFLAVLLSQSSHPIWRPKRSVEADRMTHVLARSLVGCSPARPLAALCDPHNGKTIGNRVRWPQAASSDYLLEVNDKQQ